ncbi:NAD-dependent epimerase/dehydratase family protein [Flavobacterium phycosphaerae]|uniref:NAD-dependent epimerase/dehydratase family protein n=1 Tax=Flavobacterium phycosphaerae TaxID=2697515 RepID=UPI00138A3D1A|nr:NAD(P)-dependent oxidoreductase [Flavobacterium phycosphaerae]
MKTAVVVGANGFLGSALVNTLLNQDFEVIAVYNANHDKINHKAKLVTNAEILNSAIQPDFIFYLSGNYAASAAQLQEINETLSHYVSTFSKAKMVYVSSTNVYGSTPGIVTENTPFTNPGLYAQSKLEGEIIVKAMQHFAIIRLAYIYGPGITNSSFIPAIIHSAKEHKKITLFGVGAREQDYIYIDDAVSLCIAGALQSENHIYLGATGVSVSNKQVAEEIQKHIPCNIEFTGEENGQSFYFNPKQTFEILHWRPQIGISEGIKKMLV